MNDKVSFWKGFLIITLTLMLPIVAFAMGYGVLSNKVITNHNDIKDIKGMIKTLYDLQLKNN